MPTYVVTKDRYTYRDEDTGRARTLTRGDTVELDGEQRDRALALRAIAERDTQEAKRAAVPGPDDRRLITADELGVMTIREVEQFLQTHPDQLTRVLELETSEDGRDRAGVRALGETSRARIGGGQHLDARSDREPTHTAPEAGEEGERTEGSED